MISISGKTSRYYWRLWHSVVSLGHDVSDVKSFESFRWAAVRQSNLQYSSEVYIEYWWTCRSILTKNCVGCSLTTLCRIQLIATPSRYYDTGTYFTPALSRTDTLSLTCLFRTCIITISTRSCNFTVSSWTSCLRYWLDSLVYVRARGPSSKPSHGAHWHGPTQPTTWA